VPKSSIDIGYLTRIFIWPSIRKKEKKFITWLRRGIVLHFGTTVFSLAPWVGDGLRTSPVRARPSREYWGFENWKTKNFGKGPKMVPEGFSSRPGTGATLGDRTDLKADSDSSRSVAPGAVSGICRSLREMPRWGGQSLAISATGEKRMRISKRKN
jgi:hypothetical protein